MYVRFSFLWTYLENNVLILLRVSNKTPPNTDSIPRAILFDCSLPALGSSLALLFLVPLSACVCLDCDTSLILLSTFCFVVCNSANLSSIFSQYA